LENTILVFTDGASRGNPGLSGIGIAVTNKNKKIVETSKRFIGTVTNNFAEYTALIESVKLLGKINHPFEKIIFYLDSELVVKQIKGEYKIKHKELMKLSLEFWSEIKKLNRQFTVYHIPREENKTADNLANEAIDEYLNTQKQYKD
jgi:ribonuclease HI